VIAVGEVEQVLGGGDAEDEASTGSTPSAATPLAMPLTKPQIAERTIVSDRRRTRRSPPPGACTRAEETTTRLSWVRDDTDDTSGIGVRVARREHDEGEVSGGEGDEGRHRQRHQHRDPRIEQRRRQVAEQRRGEHEAELDTIARHQLRNT
jgi:hypothetical protein